MLCRGSRGSREEVPKNERRRGRTWGLQRGVFFGEGGTIHHVRSLTCISKRRGRAGAPAAARPGELKRKGRSRSPLGEGRGDTRGMFGVRIFSVTSTAPRVTVRLSTYHLAVHDDGIICLNCKVEGSSRGAVDDMKHEEKIRHVYRRDLPIPSRRRRTTGTTVQDANGSVCPVISFREKHQSWKPPRASWRRYLFFS